MDWFYVDNLGFERGPFSTSQMRHWHQQGFFTFNRCPVRAAHQPTSAALPIHLFPTPPPFVLSLQAATAVEAAMRASAAAARLQELWLYVDVSGAQQGPFPTQQMADWYGEGYITRSISVKQVGEDVGAKWHSVEERGMDCSFVRLHHHQQLVAHAHGAAAEAAARAHEAAALYQQAVLLGGGNAVSAEHAQLSVRKDIGQHYYDHDAWQAAQQKRQRVG